MARNPIITFAVAYNAFHDAMKEGRDYTTWQDMLVDAADRLAIQDDEMEGLKDHRDEKKRRDDDFMANYRRTA